MAWVYLDIGEQECGFVPTGESTLPVLFGLPDDFHDVKVFNKAHTCWEVVLVRTKMAIWTIKSRIYAPKIDVNEA